MNKSESKYFNTGVKFDEALIALLERKPFEYVTVSELCKEAGVNRSTFYLHYENTADVLRECTRYVLEGFIEYFPKDRRDFGRLGECPLESLNFINEDYLRPYLTYIRDNRRVFEAFLSHQSTFRTDDIFSKLFDNIFAPILDRFGYPEKDRRYVMMFYLNGVTAVISEWLKDGCGKSIEEVAEIIRYCIFGRDEFPGVRD